MYIVHYNNRLHTGWSTGRSTPTVLNSAERDAILGVIQRNELIESAERQRIGKIIERVEKIKQRAADCGPRNCRYGKLRTDGMSLYYYHYKYIINIVKLK